MSGIRHRHIYLEPKKLNRTKKQGSYWDLISYSSEFYISRTKNPNLYNIIYILIILTIFRFKRSKK